jgi:hypothetical protein
MHANRTGDQREVSICTAEGERSSHSFRVKGRTPTKKATKMLPIRVQKGKIMLTPGKILTLFALSGASSNVALPNGKFSRCTYGSTDRSDNSCGRRGGTSY